MTRRSRRPRPPRRSTSTSSSTRFNAKTRRGLANFIQGQGTVYTNNGKAANRAYKFLAPGLQSTSRLLAELTRDQQTFSDFLASGSRVLGAIAERRDRPHVGDLQHQPGPRRDRRRKRRLRPLARRPAAGPAPGEHDLRQPAGRDRRPRPFDRRHRRCRTGRPDPVPAQALDRLAGLGPGVPRPRPGAAPRRARERPVDTLGALPGGQRRASTAVPREHQGDRRPASRGSRCCGPTRPT